MNTFTSDAHSNAILESISAKLIRALEFADSRSIIEAQTKQAREMTASSRKELAALQASVGVMAQKRKHADENDAPIGLYSFIFPQIILIPISQTYLPTPAPLAASSAHAPVVLQPQIRQYLPLGCSAAVLGGFWLQRHRKGGVALHFGCNFS
ncbi:hypothetical protein B0H16DRAFT_235011 [Mycena metata]|uniref:Uncharacterized protein n=1 Tax=Mycena metata TaxID=1033252 RepID=A0AAD7JQI0_9AGAR|nr:hypothetical protein B0H16DRAFT_235011 [Mycena metata]